MFSLKEEVEFVAFFCRGHELSRNESSLAVPLFCCLPWGIEIWSDFNSYCQAPSPHKQLSCIF